MELRHFRAFIAVAEELSFNRAAKTLRISQPTLSTTVQQLEDNLGVMLISRSRRHVALTPQGEMFLREAKLTVEQADRACSAVSPGARIGTLRMGLSPSVDLSLLPHVIRHLCDSHDCMQQVVPRCMTAEEQLTAIRTGAIDAGFMRPPGDKTTANLVVEKIFEEPLCLAMDPNNPLARQKRISISKIALQPLIFFERAVAPGDYDEILRLLRASNEHIHIRHETMLLQTALALAAGGLGIALVPWSTHNMRRTGIVLRRFSSPEPMLTMCLVYREGNQTPELKALREAVGYARKVCTEQSKGWMKSA